MWHLAPSTYCHLQLGQVMCFFPTASVVQTRVENIPSVLKYAVFGTGPLTVLGGVEVVMIEL